LEILEVPNGLGCGKEYPLLILCPPPLTICENGRKRWALLIFDDGCSLQRYMTEKHVHYLLIYSV